MSTQAIFTQSALTEYEALIGSYGSVHVSEPATALSDPAFLRPDSFPSQSVNGKRDDTSHPALEQGGITLQDSTPIASPKKRVKITRELLEKIQAQLPAIENGEKTIENLAKEMNLSISAIKRKVKDLQEKNPA